jgi:hypothetical protein
MKGVSMADKPDYTDLADDDVKSIEDEKLRDVLYRITEANKRILENIDDRLTGGGL